VWLNYAAYLPQKVVSGIFDENLFDVDDNLIWFRQLLGLEKHTPFECVGQVEESHLAFGLCRARGYAGKAMALAGGPDWIRSDAQPVDALFAVATDQHLIPPDLASRVLPILQQKSAAGRDFVRSWLRS
jgi:hypothetical protein